MPARSASHNGILPSARCLKLFQLLRKIYTRSLIFQHIPLPLISEGLASLLACVNSSSG
jgi:hypothetical protein